MGLHIFEDMIIEDNVRKSQEKSTRQDLKLGCPQHCSVLCVGTLTTRATNICVN